MTQNKTQIIAEMAWAHDGSIDKAMSILRQAAAAGATAISIHVTDIDSYMVPSYGSGAERISKNAEESDVFKYLKKININKSDWKDFALESKKLNLDLIVMPNDLKSLNFCQKYLEPNALVLTAASFVDQNFINEMAMTNQPTLLRIGGASLGEIESTINQFERRGEGNITLLHGFQNYPTNIEELNINQLKTLKNIFGKDIGLADHIDGSSKFATIIPILAIALGATVIEKHITYDRSEKGEDFEAALDLINFKEFVSNVRAAEIALGTSRWQSLSDAANRYRSISRKRIVASSNINIGEIITSNNISIMRSDSGVGPEEMKYILGRKAKITISKWDGINLESLV